RREAPELLFLGVEDRDRLRVEEARVPVHVVDAVPLEATHDLARLSVRDVAEAPRELAQALLPVQTQRHPVELAPLEARQVERGLAESLGRQRARVHGHAAGLGHALDDRDFLPEIRRLRRALLTGGAGAEYDEVEAVARRCSGRR